MGIVEVKNVNLILFDLNKLILLQQRDDGIEVYPGLWSFFGGGIEKGESFEDALRREVFEELEYNIRNPFFIYEQETKVGCYHGRRRLYGENYDPTQLLILREGKGMGWFSFEETEKIKMGMEDRRLINIIKII